MTQINKSSGPSGGAQIKKVGHTTSGRHGSDLNAKTKTPPARDLTAK